VINGLFKAVSFKIKVGKNVALLSFVYPCARVTLQDLEYFSARLEEILISKEVGGSAV
jgi:hypothetical protein